MNGNYFDFSPHLFEIQKQFMFPTTINNNNVNCKLIMQINKIYIAEFRFIFVTFRGISSVLRIWIVFVVFESGRSNLDW